MTMSFDPDLKRFTYDQSIKGDNLKSDITKNPFSHEWKNQVLVFANVRLGVNQIEEQYQLKITKFLKLK